MAKQTFTTGQILTAAQMTALQANDYNWTVSPKTASYTLVASDAGTRVTMTSASATTITVNTGLFTAGDVVDIINLGTGVCTITAGTATVSTSATLALKQFDAGTLFFNTAGAAVFISADAADPTASPLTTKGDLYTYSTADARLGVGTNGQVLTADSTAATGLAWTTISSSPSFVGVRTFVTGQQSISNGTGTKINWSSETFDTNSFHDNTTNNTRLTVPSGKAGYYQVYAVVVWPDSSGARQVWLEKNGSTQFAKIIENQSSGYPTGNYVSSVVNLAVGDYVEVGVYQASGGSLNTQGTSDIGGGMQFGMTYLGA